MNYQFSLLDINNQQQLIDYEKVFFQAFYSLDSPLLHKIWQWDYSRQRLRTLIPYQEQIVFLCFDHQSHLLGAMAVNLSQEVNQFSEFGFKIQEEKIKIAEILTMFKHPDYHSFWWKFYNKFIKYAYQHLEQLGVKKIYTNCASIRLMRTYQRGSWQLIETKMIGEDVRYFLELDLFAPQTRKLYCEVNL